MKIKKPFSFGPVPTGIVAKFGRIRLARQTDGRHVLIGGIPDQREAAREWCRQHAPFVVFDLPPALVLALAA